MKIIGHRGARGLAPENTLEALEAGLKAGADLLEIDVRVTSDGVPVLHHDAALAGGLAIRTHALGELRAHKDDLATLGDAIELVKQRKPMYIEIKPDTPIEPIVIIIQKYLKKGWQTSDFLFASFQFSLLEQLHTALPKIETVVIERWSGVRATSRARRLGTKYICMTRRVLWWGFVKSMQRGGYKLIAYTVNDRSPRLRSWSKHGLYGIVTDRPDRFRGQITDSRPHQL